MSSTELEPRIKKSYSCYRRLKLFSSLSTIYINLVLHCALFVISIVTSAPLRHKPSTNKLEHYLLKFGYLPHSETEIRDRVSEAAVDDAILRLQRFAHLKETGIADEETLRLMSKPRCGVPDELNGQFGGGRYKRFAVQGQKWDKTNLTWSLEKSAYRLPRDAVRGELAAALQVWSTNTTLRFRELHSDSASEADIRVTFDRGEHGDGYKFDGKGTVLAHAFFPGRGNGGDAHFDDDEDWVSIYYTHENQKGTMLFSVAAHEFGHSLGLSHSDVQGALMYPWYQSFTRDDGLPEDDVYGIQQIYGYNSKMAPNPYPRERLPVNRIPTNSPSKPNPGNRPGTKYPPPRPKDDRPNACDSTYDAISVIRNELFIFKGRYYWRLDEKGSAQNATPALITHMWHELPADLTHVDAVYERNGRDITFFIGKYYWSFEGAKVTKRKKPLSDIGIRDVEKIDGALVWGHNGKTYLFSGSQYWRLDDTDDNNFFVEYDYPRDMYVWKGVPYNIDAVFKWKDSKTYFFKGKVFWVFDDQHMKVAYDTPSLSAPFWMGCVSNGILPTVDGKTVDGSFGVHNPRISAAPRQSTFPTLIYPFILFACRILLRNQQTS